MQLSFQEYTRVSHCRDFFGRIVKGDSVEDIIENHRNLLAKYFVEEYKGNSIYCSNGKYSPYWGCQYYFKTLEDCRARIDCKNTAVIFY